MAQAPLNVSISKSHKANYDNYNTKFPPITVPKAYAWKVQVSALLKPQDDPVFYPSPDLTALENKHTPAADQTRVRTRSPEYEI